MSGAPADCQARYRDGAREPVTDDRQAFAALELFNRRKRRFEIYGRTPAHQELNEFDAYGMDVIEGRI